MNGLLLFYYFKRIFLGASFFIQILKKDLAQQNSSSYKYCLENRNSLNRIHAVMHSKSFDVRSNGMYCSQSFLTQINTFLTLQ